jgi:50S ribosomal protein L16 3-hydroxylase
MVFSDFDVDAFLKDYWQKKPMLIKNPWGAWLNPLDGDDLAGLACEEEVESRLVVKARATWKAESGPFPPERFGDLRKQPWTLLVQAVDHHVPEVAALIASFRFIPDWRIDDVMVSYASDGGGVGPHFDQYDVFLVQGLGNRRWQVGALCDADTALLPHEDLRLLADFVVTDEWLLEPGDILYVPPRIAHNGVAVGDDCMTYSIGFRAPSCGELVSHFADDVIETLSDDDRYSDAGLRVQGNPGEIGAGALAALHAMILEKMSDMTAFARWFGEYNSTPKYPEIDWSPDEAMSVEEVRQALAGGEMLCRNPASRFGFIRGEAGAVMLFVDGESYDCTAELAKFAEVLCADGRFAVDADLAQSEDVLALIVQLINQDSVAFGNGD